MLSSYNVKYVGVRCMPCSSVWVPSLKRKDFDESLAERLLGLTEMFPESLRKATCTVARSSVQLIAGGYMLSRSVVWCVATTSLLLFAPVLFEVERVNAEEMIKQDRNKLVLGPGTAMSGGPPSGLAPPPPTQ